MSTISDSPSRWAEVRRTVGWALSLADMQIVQWLPRPLLDRVVARRQRRLLEHCFLHNRFYREKWARAGVRRIEELRAPGALSRLPVTTKEELREAGLGRLSSGCSLDDGAIAYTSGSTGEPLPIFTPHDTYGRYLAAYVRTLTLGGYRPWQKITYIRGAGEQQGSYGPFFRAAHVTTLQEGGPAGLLRRVLATAPDALVTDAGVLGSLLAVDRDDELRGLGLVCAIVGGAISDRGERLRMGERLGCPVLDEYSTMETWAIASECSEGGSHLAVDNTTLEIVDADGHAVAPGERGRALVTSLSNLAFPVVRYEVGDQVTRAPHGATCRCGRSLPLLGPIAGRAVERLVGIEVAPLALVHVVQGCAGYQELGRWTLHQTALASIDLEYAPARASGESADARAIADRVARALESYLGSAVRVHPRLDLTLGASLDDKRRVIRSSVGSSRAASLVSSETQGAS